jgi:hypothetical protein
MVGIILCWRTAYERHTRRMRMPRLGRRTPFSFPSFLCAPHSSNPPDSIFRTGAAACAAAAAAAAAEGSEYEDLSFLHLLSGPVPGALHIAAAPTSSNALVGSMTRETKRERERENERELTFGIHVRRLIEP